MFLKSLTLRQFRNHSDLDLSVDPEVNLFLGSNGAGKTNLLEAISVLATGNSPRGADCDSMVAFGTDGFFVKGVFSAEDAESEPFSLDVKFQGRQRRIRLDGKNVIRLKDLFGRVPMVTFVPEDLGLVKGEPDLRRRAVNSVLSQVNASYGDLNRRYSDAVRARNAVLRQIADGELNFNDLAPWDDQIIKLGLDLCKARADFADEFSGRITGVQHRISGGHDDVAMAYQPSLPQAWADDAEERWRRDMDRLRAAEVASGYTLKGPHRDDFGFLLNGRPAKSFASEGQMRTSAVSFKLAEVAYIHEKRGQRPICLLDDVLSELDSSRADHLLRELSKTGQAFVTMTGLESWPKDQELPAAIFQVDEKGVSPHPELGHKRVDIALSVH